jgi:hypothetical protein
MDKRWLSQLLADSAFPLLVRAVGVSQIKIGHHKKDALRKRGRQSSEVQTVGQFDSRPTTESSRSNAKTGSDKEPSHGE